VDLPLAAERAAPAPLSVQIVGQLRTAMSDGRLAAGERLPSTRALATTLGVSRTVVTGAYAQLFAEGWIEAGEVECPLHATRFCLRDGVPQCLPATKPVPTYRVKIEGDDVYVALNAGGQGDTPGSS